QQAGGGQCQWPDQLRERAPVRLRWLPEDDEVGIGGAERPLRDQSQGRGLLGADVALSRRRPRGGSRRSRRTTMRARPDNAVQPEGAGQADPAGSSANPSEPATGIYLIEPPSRELGDKFPRLPRVGIWEHHLPENRILISDGVCQIVGVDPEF